MKYFYDFLYFLFLCLLYRYCIVWQANKAKASPSFSPTRRSKTKASWSISTMSCLLVKCLISLLATKLMRSTQT